MKLVESKTIHPFFLNRDEPKTVEQASMEQRRKWAERIRALKTQELKKGTTAETSAVQLEPKVAAEHKLSTLARVEFVGEEVIIHAGPRDPVQATGNFDPSAVRYNVSSVFTGREGKYDHGNVYHEPEKERSVAIQSLTKSALEVVPIEAVVNPTDAIATLVKEKKIDTAILDVDPKHRSMWEDKVKKMGLRLAHTVPGFCFLGRESLMSSYRVQKWVGLIPPPVDSVESSLERCVISSSRYETVHHTEWYFDAKFFYYTPAQMQKKTGLPYVSRVIASNFPLPPVESVDQNIGELRFLDTWPELEQEGEFRVRKKGDVYYDIEMPYMPYAQRRRVMLNKGWKVVPFSMQGTFSFTLTGFFPLPVGAPALVARQKKKIKKGGVFFLWSATVRPGFTPLVRGGYKKVEGERVGRVVYVTEMVVAEDLVFPSVEEMRVALSVAEYQQPYTEFPVASDRILDLYERIKRGENIHASYSLPDTVRMWRSMPGMWVVRGRIEWISWNCPYLNEGIRCAVLVVTGDLHPRERDVLRNSGWFVESLAGRHVLRDQFSPTGITHYWGGTLDWTYRVRDVSQPKEVDEFAVVY